MYPRRRSQPHTISRHSSACPEFNRRIALGAQLFISVETIDSVVPAREAPLSRAFFAAARCPIVFARSHRSRRDQLKIVHTDTALAVFLFAILTSLPAWSS